MKLSAVIVTGSRDWTDAATIRDALLRTKSELGDFHVLEGGARGADQLARAAVHELGLVTREFPADWKRYGKRAGTIRNAEMLRIAQTDEGTTTMRCTLFVQRAKDVPSERVRVLAFPLPQSIGTRHMLATSAPAVIADAGVAHAAKVETREFDPVRLPLPRVQRPG